MPAWIRSLGALSMMTLVALTTEASADERGQARRIFRATGVTSGLVVHLGCGTGRLTAALRGSARQRVHGLDADAANVRQARQYIKSLGLYGAVSVDSFDGKHLPYIDNLANLVVAEDLGDVSLDEVMRVLAPLGVAYVKQDDTWKATVKPWPADIDEWTHYLHSADGNPVANDRVVGPPQHYQWVAGPVWAQSHETDSNVRNLVTARGRIFYLVNEAPTSLAGPYSPPDKWLLSARDAFNGFLLWQVPIKQWGWRQWKPSWFTPRPGVIPLNLDKRLVAAGDMLYVTLGYRAPVSQLDARTGEVLRTYEGTARTSEILHHDGSLVLTTLKDNRAVVQRIDAASGRRLWQSDLDYGGTVTDYYRFSAVRGRVPAAKVDPTLNIATDGNAVVLLDGDSVVCLDGQTGRQRWRSRFPLADSDHNAGRIAAQGRVWVGTLIINDGVVLHASPNQLAAFAVESGELRWQQPKKYLQHLWYEWKDVFVIDELVWTWSDRLAREPLKGSSRSSSWPVSINGYDLRTGELRREVALGNIFKTHHHHRCYRNKATVKYVLASRRGTEYVDLLEGKHSVHNWVRGTCHMGMVPANGLQYAPPHPCQCYIDEKLNGMNALAPARKMDSALASRPPVPRLLQGPAYATVASPPGPSADSTDWSTFRADVRRSGSVNTSLPSNMELLWQVKLGDRVTAPISVGERIFVPLADEHEVAALNASDGTILWRFTAGGRIDSPPTYHRGGIVFGSADGSVYRVRAADGQLVWQFRAAPADLRMGAFGQLESVWPVHGSVLVHQDIAFFAAGRSSHLDGGLYLYAIDALSGEVRHEKTFTGPSYTVDNIDQNYLLAMGVLPDILRMEDSAIFMRGVKFDTSLVRRQGTPHMKLRGGFLDDAYFKRMPWSIGKSGHARLIVHDDQRAFCLRMFDSLQGLDPKVYFTPGKQGYLLFAHDLATGKNVWAQRIPIRGRAMVVTDDQLCVAGPPDVVHPDDPLAAFEGRMGGVLRVVDKMDGHTVSEHQLAAPPVFNGAAAANGRLILTLRDGSVVCFGPTTSKPHRP